MANPFIFPVADFVRGRETMPRQSRQSGSSPSRIGPEMIAIAEGAPVSVEATLAPVGAGILVDAEISAVLEGECVRCLRPLNPETTIRISQVYAIDESFISGDEEDDSDEGSGDELGFVKDEKIDIEQAVIDEAGLSLPFNPTCVDGCDDEGDSDVPAPDGEVDAEGNITGGEDPRIDPRWADLEKFL